MPWVASAIPFHLCSRLEASPLLRRMFSTKSTPGLAEVVAPIFGDRARKKLWPGNLRRWRNLIEPRSSRSGSGVGWWTPHLILHARPALAEQTVRWHGRDAWRASPVNCQNLTVRPNPHRKAMEDPGLPCDSPLADAKQFRRGRHNLTSGSSQNVFHFFVPVRKDRVLSLAGTTRPSTNKRPKWCHKNSNELNDEKRPIPSG